MSFNYSEQHSKSIAIGKIMGATVKQSVWKLSRRFILLSLVAIVLAVPLCVKAMNFYLQDFYQRIDFPWFVILLSAFITILVVIFSILGQTIRIANRNPIEGIKTE
ncbi:MAG: FtsX-like permease family protein, partial [Bacteroidales bacterium]|nr:FtsX-like permease family protein [Bacteroidales bacterium]